MDYDGEAKRIIGVVDDIVKTSNPCAPGRPYDGQSHTDQGERGKTVVSGLTMRDVCDCFVLGWLDASGRGNLIQANACDYRDVHTGDNPTPLAVMQNMVCWIEKKMGIWPNISPEEAEDGNK